MRWGALPLTVLAIGVAWAPAAVLADDGVLGSVGSAVVPLESDQVTMVAEWIDAAVVDGEARVTCVFTFSNGGPPVEILMGFPERSPSSSRGEETEILDFAASVDGAPLPVRFRLEATPAAGTDTADGSGPYRGWHTFTVPFAAGQTRVVRNTYRGTLGRMSDGSRTFRYVVATGASWRGPIGEATIRVIWSDDEVVPGSVQAHPEPAAWTGSSASWRFRELEPTSDQDIFFSYVPRAAATAAAASATLEADLAGSGAAATTAVAAESTREAIARGGRRTKAAAPPPQPVAERSSTPPSMAASDPAPAVSRGRALALLGAAAVLAAVAAAVLRSSRHGARR